MPGTMILISGVTGVIGEGIFKKLANNVKKDVRIVCIFRSKDSAETFTRKFADKRSQVIPLYYDLTEPLTDNILSNNNIEKADFCLGIHCAADVSWNKSVDEVYPINVSGSIHFCGLLSKISASSHLIYISSAYTSATSWNYRNGYEKSKALAEIAIKQQFPELDISTFSCSLVVGETANGYINRFHGLYPLIKLLYVIPPPFLVGMKNCLIDLVPLDWVIDELSRLCFRHLNCSKPEIVVASAGNTRITLRRLIELLQIHINKYREENEQPLIDSIPIIKPRQWEFLKRSLEKWQPPELSIKDFKYMIYLLDIYYPYTISDNVLPPCNTYKISPSFEDYHSVVLDYWVKENEQLLRRKWAKNNV